MSEPGPARMFDGMKFMWDGKLFDEKAAAQLAADAYRTDKFEVRLAEHEGKHLVYTRRVVQPGAVTTP